MEELYEFRDWEDLRTHLRVRYSVELLDVKPYSGPDERIGWPSTWIAMARWPDGREDVIGFVDGQVGR